MSPRLAFVPTLADAPPSAPDLRVVVLDTAWTPASGDRADVLPARPAMSDVLARTNLFEESLARLDAWALAVGLDDLLLADGVAWWYRIRPSVWYELNELMLWRLVAAELDRHGPFDEFIVPRDRPILAAAIEATARASGATVALAQAAVDATTAAEAAAGADAGPDADADVAAAAARPDGHAAHAVPHAGRPASWRSRPARAGLIARIARRLNPLARPQPALKAPSRAAEMRSRLAVLDGRLAAAAQDRALVLVVGHAWAFQVVGTESNRRVDPQLEPVVRRLATDGIPALSIALDLDHRRDPDWEAILADPSILPASYVAARYDRPEDRGIHSATVGDRDRRVEVPLRLDGVDLAPAVVAAIDRYATTWLDSQRRTLVRVARLMAELRPALLFLDHEGVRTPYVAAARRAGVPIVAVQHGVIYPTHPVYRHRRLPTIPLPDVTCVFGPYERMSLLVHGGYLPGEVAVTGSPRLEWEADDARPSHAREEERRAVRDELGVAADDLLLVVSTANTWIVRDVHVVDMIARTLGGPIPGVHLVFKQHPGEADDGPYRMLLGGLAAAGGYAVPPMTVVRNIDLYRLLRAADAHLGLHSTVLTDAVAAGTPNLISIGQAYRDLLGYVEAGVARPVRDVADVRAALADPRPADPAARARFLAAHFLEGDAAGRIAREIRAAMAGATAGQA